jgi:hypothetical protein
VDLFTRDLRAVGKRWVTRPERDAGNTRRVRWDGRLTLIYSRRFSD